MVNPFRLPFVDSTRWCMMSIALDGKSVGEASTKLRLLLHAVAH